MIHCFHYEGIAIHNSIFTIMSKPIHLTDTLYPIEAKSSIYVI